MLRKKPSLEGWRSQRFVPCARSILRGVNDSEVNSVEQRTEVTWSSGIAAFYTSWVEGCAPSLPQNWPGVDDWLIPPLPECERPFLIRCVVLLGRKWSDYNNVETLSTKRYPELYFFLYMDFFFSLLWSTLLIDTA